MFLSLTIAGLHPSLWGSKDNEAVAMLDEQTKNANEKFIQDGCRDVTCNLGEILDSNSTYINHTVSSGSSPSSLTTSTLN